MTINVLRCFNSLNFKISCVFDRRKASHAWKRHYRVSKWWLHFHFCMKYHFKNYRWRSHNTCALRFSETSRESNVCVSVNSLAWHNVAHPRSWLGSSCPLLANTDRWCLSEGSVASCHASGAGQKATETINDKPIRVASFNYVHRLNQSECCSLSHTAWQHQALVPLFHLQVTNAGAQSELTPHISTTEMEMTKNNSEVSKCKFTQSIF